ncbi:MAG: 50S ribosome-binding GTPase, partial [Planctomycetes bacterium]|nr:50S ribosome-binding GTPase [Planctomycetota bacterium]
MKIGLVGYQGGGKSTVFELLTGVPADPAKVQSGQLAVATVPDDRFDRLVAFHNPKKTVPAKIELLDTPGLNRSQPEGNAQRLGIIREATALVQVVGVFAGVDAVSDVAGFADDVVLADLQVVSNRIERLKKDVTKPRPDRDLLQAELAALEPIASKLDEGEPLLDFQFNEVQEKACRSFSLLSTKKRLIILNSHNDHLEGMGMDCQMCHTAAASSRVSSDRILPNKKDGCAPCHDVESEDMCVVCHAEGMPRERFANPRREIAFNHALHTGDLALDCRHCHRGMDGVMYSQDNPTALPMMAICMDCHDDMTAPKECELCHLNTQNLRPEFHTTTFLADHRRLARTGVFPENQDCTMCHRDSWCQECHDDVRLVVVHSTLMDRYAT